MVAALGRLSSDLFAQWLAAGDDNGRWTTDTAELVAPQARDALVLSIGTPRGDEPEAVDASAAVAV
jgi:hypothetical protein